MTITKAYDFLNRLTGTFHVAGGSNVAVFNYANNSANQRTAITNVDNSRWVYQYDALGQVTSGRKYWADGMPVAGQQFEYGFDDIGNRKVTASGGDAVGANLRYASYSANSLNQYTSRDVPGFVNVIGTAANLATVTLWGDNGAFSPTSRKGDYFRGELAVTNTANPVWLTITNLAVLNDGSNPDIVTNAIGRTFVPQTPEMFYYDADGNLTNDGRWIYTWDAENRLVQQESLTAAPTGSKFKLEFAYDARGRRLQKLVSTNNGSAYVAQYTNRFIYDGWNLLATLNPQLETLNAFVWGLDLSGTLQGAGGVGGLLLVRNAELSVTNFVAHDGNGNVAALVNVANGGVAAQYEYGPFGELLRATGESAKVNPFRFSTKYQDDESDFLYYGYRSYNPSTGRWLNRDPLGELGGANLYGFVDNDGVNQIDALGLQIFPQPPPPTPAFDITAIPGIMTANGWNNAAALQNRWFSNPAIGPQLPDTTTIKMSWVLGYARAKKVYDDIINQKLYVNAAAIAQIKKTHGNKNGAFGDFTLPVPVLDAESIQFRVVGFSLTDPIDDLSAALGNFTFRVVVKGCATAGAIGITHIGIYVKDSFDFQGNQSLGYWNKATNYGGRNPLKGTLVSNSDYRAYAQRTGFGGDFLVFSDLVVTKLSPHEVILK